MSESRKGFFIWEHLLASSSRMAGAKGVQATEQDPNRENTLLFSQNIHVTELVREGASRLSLPEVL